MDIGNGDMPTDAQGDVTLPDRILLNKAQNIVDEIFGCDINTEDVETLSKTAILCPTNQETLAMNDAVLSRIRGTKQKNLMHKVSQKR